MKLTADSINIKNWLYSTLVRKLDTVEDSEFLYGIVVQSGSWNDKLDKHVIFNPHDDNCFFLGSDLYFLTLGNCVAVEDIKGTNDSPKL